MNKTILTFFLIGLLIYSAEAQVSVSLPQLNASEPIGSIIEIPVSVDDLTGLNVIAYQFTMNFDPSVLLPDSPYISTSGTLSSGSSWSVMANPNISGQITVGAFGSGALAGSGHLLKLIFKVMVANGSTPMNFSSFLFNAGNPSSTAINGSFTNFDCSESQTIVIPAGWSGISSFINPSVNNMVNMFSSISNQLLLVKNFTGSYSPILGISPNEPWNPYSGYFIKLTEPAVFTICGQDITNRQVSLVEGWNIVPVLADCIYFLDEVMNGLNFRIIQEAATQNVYWPEKGIQTLDFFEPGKAYLINMNSPGVLIFSGCK